MTLDPLAHVRVGICLAGGILAGALTTLAGDVTVACVVAWDVAALLYLGWIWLTVWPLGAEATAQRAAREDPGRALADAMILSASLVSLVAIGALLVQAGHESGGKKDLLIGVGVLSVVLGWAVVHTVYALRYARVHYRSGDGQGVEFEGPDKASYRDFAYLAFTLGMTFQVSDTDLQGSEMRAVALRHALLSYVFGAIVIATTINLVAGLTTS